MYFQSRMKKEFSQDSKHALKIIIPSKPILSVVAGATCFGINNSFINWNILQKTYGVMTTVSVEYMKELNVSPDTIDEHKYYDDTTEQWLISNYFMIIAKKGQEMKFGQIYKASNTKANDIGNCWKL